MYLAFAKRRRLTAEVLAERFTAKEDAAYLHVSGLGAFGLLRRESGLHQFIHRYATKALRVGKERHLENR